MTEPGRLLLPLDPALARELRAGERVLLTGEVYAARDAAHARLYQALLAGEPLPISLLGSCLYYVGPSPTPDGRPIGAAGPTTSSRLDPYTPLLIEHGVVAMVGKGRRGAAVREAIIRHGAVYFVATGGAGALLAQAIETYEIIAYPDLGPEALARMRVRDFPVIVGLDSAGRDIYVEGPRRYALDAAGQAPLQCE